MPDLPISTARGVTYKAPARGIKGKLAFMALLICLILDVINTSLYLLSIFSNTEI
jgi:hypothetical protein